MPEEKTLSQLTGELLDHVFSGSAEKLVMHALQAGRVGPEELERIRQLLDELERRQR